MNQVGQLFGVKLNLKYIKLNKFKKLLKINKIIFKI
jgi:hypothetical protein